MKKGIEITNPDELYDPKPHAYSHIAAVSTKDILVFVAGQGGATKDGVLSEDFRLQVEIAFNNIKIALKSKSLNMDDIAKMTTLVVDYDEQKHQILIEESNKIWPNMNFPANTLIPVTQLALRGMLIEIDAIAIGK